jgi:hypothetical protein
VGAAPNLTGRMTALDQLIVAALLVLPQSYLLWFRSHEFGAPLLSRVWVFAVPAVLVGLRWALGSRRTSFRTDPVVVGVFGVVTAIGLVNALVRTDFPLNVLSTYFQQIYWMALAGLFLVAVVDRDASYVLTLIRRCYLAISAVGVAYVAVALVFGDRLPHRDVVMPNGGYLAQNFYVSLAYPEKGVLLLPVARYTSLFREPKVLAMHLLIGLALQSAHVWGAWDTKRRASTVTGLVIMFAGFFLANSLFAYLVCLMLLGFVADAPRLAVRGWRGFRRLALWVIAIGIPTFVVVLLGVGQDRGLMYRLALASGKHFNAVRGYVVGIPRAFFAAWSFPLGTGSMNLDSPRYETLYGIATSGGTTLVQWAAQNAGLVGLGLLAVLLWRLFGTAERTAARLTDRELQGACLAVACLTVTSAMVSDLLLIGAEGTLLVGWLLNLSRTVDTPVTAAR